MHLVVAVLEDVTVIPKIMSDLVDNDINGATVLDTYGMGRILSRSHKEIPQKEMISYILSENRPTNRTIFVIVDETKMQKTVDIFQNRVGNFKSPRTGILFTIEIDKFFG
ncbi:MAG: P-II family nitrogen regulator [Candidatus Zixiibacteriota bacterium]